MSEQPQPPREAAFFTSIREWGLVRGTSGILGGVVDGVGNRVGLARVPARLLTVVALILLPGLVMLAYAAGWALLPDAKGNIIIQDFGRGITNVGALIGIAILTFLGIVSFDSGIVVGRLFLGRDYWSEWGLSSIWFLIPVFLFLAFVTGMILLVVWLVKRSNSNTADARVASAPHGTPATGASSAQANTHQTPGTPQPWEPALLPGDPRAGAPASSGTVRPAANAAYSAGATPSASPTNSAPASAPPPPAPARPPAPTVPGPGRGAYLSFAAVLLISAAVVAWLSRSDMLAVMPIVAWGAAITVGLGAILVVVGLTGRKLGFLGFLSVFAVLLAVLFAANADLVRDRYETTWVWDEEVVFEPDDLVLEEGFDNSVDLTAELANDYSAVFIAGSCTSPSEVEPWSEVKYFGESMASMRLDTVDDDVDIDLVASYTRLEIPTGASLEVVGSAYTTVVWEDRDSSCSAWSNDYEEEYDEDGYAVLDSSQTLLSVTNPNAPVITINAGTGTDKSIYIQEVAP